MEERYSRVLDYQIPVTQLKGAKGRWRYTSSNARLKSATYSRL